MSNLYKYLKTAIEAGYGKETESTRHKVGDYSYSNKEKRCQDILTNIMIILHSRVENDWEEAITSSLQREIWVEMGGTKQELRNILNWNKTYDLEEDSDGKIGMNLSMDQFFYKEVLQENLIRFLCHQLMVRHPEIGKLISFISIDGKKVDKEKVEIFTTSFNRIKDTEFKELNILIVIK